MDIDEGAGGHEAERDRDLVSGRPPEGDDLPYGELTRGRMFGGPGGAAVAGAALSAAATLASGYSDAGAAASVGTAGLAGAGRNSIEVMGRIDQNGAGLTAVSHAIRIGIRCRPRCDREVAREGAGKGGCSLPRRPLAAQRRLTMRSRGH